MQEELQRLAVFIAGQSAAEPAASGIRLPPAALRSNPVENETPLSTTASVSRYWTACRWIDYPLEVAVEIYWLLGQYIGRPVAQKWNGEMIYNVRDTGQNSTSMACVDRIPRWSSFFIPTMHSPEWCRTTSGCCAAIRRRKAGSAGSAASTRCTRECWNVTRMRTCSRLYQPMYFDRQKEHAEGAPPVCLAPYFSWNGDRLNARANSSLVRKGYEVAGEVHGYCLFGRRAGRHRRPSAASEEIWYEAPLERGQIQYLNNHEVGHYRSAFRDHDDPDKKRHLFRLWHRERGSACYDGEYL